MTAALGFELDAVDGAARAGRVVTARGQFRTPCFMPVGTRASVKALSPADMDDLGAEVVLANTYHLMLRPGAGLVADLGGLHGFMSWTGHVLTDSGGFQVFSLSPAVDDDGVTFKSTYDGSTHRLTPEGAVAVQEQLGADIQMVLDVCPPYPSPPDALALAVDRTLRWAERAKRAHRREGQALFGIVQGGTDPDLRRRSATATVSLGFDGYGIGGLAVGESRPEMAEALAAAVEHLPADRPRYLMGVGDPVGLLDAISDGVDMFDCVLPTRLARHGSILTGEGRLSLKSSAFERDAGPLDPACECPVCARWSRAYLRHLLRVGEPSALRLLSLHNVAWTLALVARARQAVSSGTLSALRSEVTAVWGEPPGRPVGGGRNRLG